MRPAAPKFENYSFKVEPLKKEDGGGFVITFPDLPGCMSDGATYEEAIENGREAFQAWMDSMKEDGKSMPKPGSEQEAPAKFVLRLPRSIHARLTARASAEGVSLNSLVQVYVAEAMGKREGRSAEKTLVKVRRRPIGAASNR